MRPSSPQHPGFSQMPPSTTKGATKRVFTYKEEQEMANKIDEVLADGSGYVVGDDIATFALYNYRRLRGAVTRGQKPFSASAGWLVSFKQRWGFCSKRPRIKKHASNPNVGTWRKQFLTQIESLTRGVPPDRVLVVDETFWRVVCGAVLTWCRVGEINRKTTVTDLKADITVGYTVAMSGKVLQP